MDKPIPAFYACYLLRSTVRHASLYVGSTPNPARRLRQHNGESKGGAVRTSKDSLRPWEMTCLVTGFPSKIAALQFEWAWQNTHLSRHIAPDSRISQAKMTVRYSPKTARVRKRSARPRLCLTDRLANLHLLLRASSFERWPLKVTFYAEDVWRVWQKWNNGQLEKVRDGIEINFNASDLPLAKTTSNDCKHATESAKGIRALDVGYGSLKTYIEKSRAKFTVPQSSQCSLCSEALRSDGAGSLLCPTADCSMVSHVDCLSAHFLREESSNNQLLPTAGSCPRCHTKLHWSDLVKELSLRMRGQDEIEALYKQRRARSKKSKHDVAGVDGPTAAGSEESDDELPEEEDDWNYFPASSDIDSEERRTRSNPSPFRKTVWKETALRPPIAETDTVIEDSDWEAAEVVS